ncbi:hypothetical protein [Sporomusa acidovorans]|uniref:hypothetical protein n=1 Tax=Sporomusa acidovorans TaxID=112900 RepID=UPI0015A4EB3A|nr:hypothetical protein [Sporomusa acidovorans]
MKPKRGNRDRAWHYPCFLLPQWNSDVPTGRVESLSITANPVNPAGFTVCERE